MLTISSNYPPRNGTHDLDSTINYYDQALTIRPKL